MDEKILQKILEIEQQSFPVPWKLENYNEILNNKSYEIHKIYENEDIAGFAITIDMIDAMEIIRIAIDKNYRRKGFAEKLIRNIIFKTKTKLYENIFLEVRASNKAAINLYEKTGFEKIMIRKKYYSDNEEDAIIMKLELQIKI